MSINDGETNLSNQVPNNKRLSIIWHLKNEKSFFASSVKYKDQETTSTFGQELSST